MLTGRVRGVSPRGGGSRPTSRDPASVVTTAKGSVGGAALAARGLRAAGPHSAARGLDAAAVQAFLHGLAYGCTVAGGVAAAGFVLVVIALPGRLDERPRRPPLKGRPALTRDGSSARRDSR